MKNVAVVFDTNACRDICKSALVEDPAIEWKKYDACMKARGIVSFANPYVFMELMAHLADQSDPDNIECRLAVSALYNLCSINSRQVRILSDSEALILCALYHKTLSETEQTTQKICTLALHVVENTPGVLDPKTEVYFREIKEHLNKVEQQFIADVWQFVVKELNPLSKGWEPLKNDKITRDAVIKLLRSELMPQTIAIGFVRKAMSQAQVVETFFEMNDKAKFVRENFPASIQLYKEILKRIVETGCNLGKKERANWIWDIQIALGVGKDIETINKPLHLVTTDGDIVSAAEDADCREYVHSLSEFKMIMGI